MIVRVMVAAAAATMTAFTVVPLAALLLRLPASSALQALYSPAAHQALLLSLETTAISLAITILFGTPLAYVVARADFPGKRLVDALVDLPIVLPPAVAGLALLLAFGRQGLLGPPLRGIGVTLSFTTAAVIMAQVFVAAPFYVRAARSGLLSVDRQLENASASLGMTAFRTFFRITVPLALPALLGGAILCWARALGEFGATIMFAGNLAGISQTLPLAVYLGLEGGDLNLAIALSIVLIAISLSVVVGARTLER